MRKGIVSLGLCLIISIGLFSCGGGGGSSNSSGNTSDTTAPSVPTGLTATTASSSSISLNWTASTDDVGVAGYKIFRNGAQISTATTNSFADTSLTSSTTYTYAVSACDAAGNNSAQSAAASATTLDSGVTDITPPSTPTNLTAVAVSSTQINLSWAASTDNEGVTAYKIFRDGTYLTTATTTTAADTGLTASTTYCYAVSAIDAANNESRRSSQACATVTPAPLVSIAISPKDTTILNATSKQFTATGTFADGTKESLTSQVSWTSSDPTTVFVNASGKATAIGIGTAKIIGVSDLISDDATVNVIEQGSVWTNRSAAGTLRSCAWSGSRFVAVGDNGAVLISPDGVAWSEIVSSITGTLYGIAWSGTKYVAVGGSTSSNDIFTSNDGLTWEQQSVANTNRLRGIIWAGSEFLAVGDIYFSYVLHNVIRSNDGVTWTSSFSGKPLHGIAWSGSTYVAVGNYGTYLTSTDASWWSINALGSLTPLNSVAWSGSEFVAVGYGGAILTSPDGLTWASQTSGTTSTLNSIVWSGSRLVAVGDSGTILTSPDGRTWTSQPSNTTNALYSLVWSGTQFVIVGDSGTILTSP